MMPDLQDIKNPVFAKDSRSLEIHFGDQGQSMSLPFQFLSDCEKCMVIWAKVAEGVWRELDEPLVELI
jgi:hypothetical protein